MRKLILILTLILLMSIPVFGDAVEATIADFTVTVNGEEVLTNESQYPVLVYNEITYFPLTYDYLNGLGLTLSYTNETGLIIDRADTERIFRQEFLGSDNVLGSKVIAAIADYSITVNGKGINNSSEEYPILVYNQITYFPMTWRFTNVEFGWATGWSQVNGFSIVTKSDELEPEIEITKLEESDIESIYPAVVKIEVTKGSETIVGNGFYYGNNGNIITDFTLVEDADKVLIIDADGSMTSSVTVIGYSENLGLAALDTGNSEHLSLTLGNDLLSMDQPVYPVFIAEGYDFSEEWVYNTFANKIEYSFDSIDGIAGAPLLDNQGNVVGVISSSMSDEDTGIAVPINLFKNLPKTKDLSVDEFKNELNKKYSTSKVVNYDNGDKFYGVLKNDAPDGYGKYIWSNGASFVGNFDRGVFYGEGVYTKSNGTVYTGSFENSNFSGYGEMIYSNGEAYYGYWKDNEFDGEGIYAWPNGDYFSGSYVNSEKQGNGMFFYLNGEYFVGSYKNDMRNGYGVLTYPSGEKLEGQWIDNEYIIEEEE